MVAGIGRAYGKARVALSQMSPRAGTAFPNRIAIEPASACNLECPMCPTPTKSRKNGIMSVTLFRRTVDEIAEHGVDRLFLHLWGEPLVHPQIADLIAYAARSPSIGETVMSTNATFLGPDKTDGILRSGLTWLVFSLDGASRETYEMLRVGARFESTIENVEGFLKRRRTLGYGPRVVFQIIEMKQTVEEIDAFRRRWAPLLQAGDEILVKPYNQWSEHDGAIERPGIPFRTPCFSFLWDFLAVTWNGRVLPCCFDCEAEMVVGDANTSSLREIWNGTAMRELRAAHLDFDFERYPLCAGCDHTTERLDALRIKSMLRSRLGARPLVKDPV